MQVRGHSAEESHTSKGLTRRPTHPPIAKSCQVSLPGPPVTAPNWPPGLYSCALNLCSTQQSRESLETHKQSPYPLLTAMQRLPAALRTNRNSSARLARAPEAGSCPFHNPGQQAPAHPHSLFCFSSHTRGLRTCHCPCWTFPPALGTAGSASASRAQLKCLLLRKAAPDHPVQMPSAQPSLCVRVCLLSTSTGSHEGRDGVCYRSWSGTGGDTHKVC